MQTLIKTYKKNIFQTIWFVLLSFFGIIFASMSSICCASSVEAFAKYCGKNVVYSEVISNRSNDSFREFFTLADDDAGKENKNNTEAYVLSQATSDYYPLEFIFNDTTLKVENAVCYTTWQFKKFHYGLKTKSGEDFKELNSDEVYIDETVAETLSILSKIPMSELKNHSFSASKNNIAKIIKVIDIVKKGDNPYFGHDIKGGYIISNYDKESSNYKFSKYCAYLRGDSLSKNYSIKYLESAKNTLNQKKETYKISYHSFINQKETVNISQIFEETDLFLHSYKNLFLIFFVISLIIVFFIIFVKYNFKTWNCVCGSFCGLLIYSLFYLGSGILKVGNIIIPVINMSSFIFVIIFFCLLIAAIFISQKVKGTYIRPSSRKVVKI